MKVGERLSKSERASGRRMQDWRRTRVVVGSSRAAAQGIWLGSAQVAMYLGQVPRHVLHAVAGSWCAVGCWQGISGDQLMERGGRKRWTGTAGGGTSPKVGLVSLLWLWTSGHLGVGQTPGTDTAGTLGTSQLGQSQGCGTNRHLEGPAARTLEACFHSPVEHGHSAGWESLPRHLDVSSCRQHC